ncbi:hypothetical protein H488_0107650 [Kocuria sp. UCD-OTCP]|nr:hypothetical protein H488_0107650 [Kocuria sp. UCD-OTCP]
MARGRRREVALQQHRPRGRGQPPGHGADGVLGPVLRERPAGLGQGVGAHQAEFGGLRQHPRAPPVQGAGQARAPPAGERQHVLGAVAPRRPLGELGVGGQQRPAHHRGLRGVGAAGEDPDDRAVREGQAHRGGDDVGGQPRPDHVPPLAGALGVLEGRRRGTPGRGVRVQPHEPGQFAQTEEPDELGVLDPEGGAQPAQLAHADPARPQGGQRAGPQLGAQGRGPAQQLLDRRRGGVVPQPVGHPEGRPDRRLRGGRGPWVGPAQEQPDLPRELHVAGVHGEEDAVGQEPVDGPGAGVDGRVDTAQGVRQSTHGTGAEPFEDLPRGGGPLREVLGGAQQGRGPRRVRRPAAQPGGEGGEHRPRTAQARRIAAEGLRQAGHEPERVVVPVDQAQTVQPVPGRAGQQPRGGILRRAQQHGALDGVQLGPGEGVEGPAQPRPGQQGLGEVLEGLRARARGVGPGREQLAQLGGGAGREIPEQPVREHGSGPAAAQQGAHEDRAEQQEGHREREPRHHREPVPGVRSDGREHEQQGEAHGAHQAEHHRGDAEDVDPGASGGAGRGRAVVGDRHGSRVPSATVCR